MVLIKNVKIVDGTGKDPYPNDVLINGDKISAIGNFPNKKTDLVIEGLGGYLTPGFIDSNSSSDHYLSLFTNPSQERFLLQGVTSIIGGHCGSSLAPLLYGSLESIQKWSDTNTINVNWHSFAEFINIIKKLKLGVNFGSLVGHSTIRRALIGDDARDLTEKELKVFQQIIDDAINEGALGLSTGLSYIHSRQTPYHEIKKLAEVLNQHHATYTSHLRNEKEDVFNSVNETLNLFKETGVKTIISHFRPLLGYQKDYDGALELIDKSTDTMDFHFDIHPFNTSIVPIYTLLPEWAQVGNRSGMLDTISNKTNRKKIEKELPKFKKGDVTIAHASNNEFLNSRELETKELIDAMLSTGLNALVFFRNIDEKRAIKALFSNKAIIASNSGGLGERSIATFTRWLEIASKDKKYPFSRTIKKITGTPAKKFNLKNRGLIKEGLQADLTLIVNNQIKYVLVNGEIAVHQGKYQGTSSGQVITSN